MTVGEKIQEVLMGIKVIENKEYNLITISKEIWDSDYQGEPTIPLSVIEKIKAEIERKRDRIKEVEPQSVTASMSGFVLACSEALAIIDKAVKECTHE